MCVRDGSVMCVTVYVCDMSVMCVTVYVCV